MHNTVYDAVKSSHPNITFGGPDVTTLHTARSATFLEYYLANTTGKNDFYSFHIYQGQYSSNTDANVLFTNATSLYDSLCAKYGLNCTRKLVTEFGIQNASVTVNDSRMATMVLTTMYAAMLNYAPSSLSVFGYKMFADSNYTTNTAAYEDYPHRYQYYSDRRLENNNYYGFNVTKDIFTYFTPGRNISSFTSDNTGIYGAASLNSSSKYAMLINKNTTTQTFSISLSGLSGVVMRDAKTLAIQSYNTTTNVFTVSIANSSVNYYEFVSAAPPTISLSGPLNSSINTSGSLNFTFVPSEQYGIVTCSLIVNGTAYATTNATDATVNNFTVTGINSSSVFYQNPLNWSINCTDNAGNVNSSATWQVYTALYTSGTGNIISILNNVSYAATVPLNLSTNSIVLSSPVLTFPNGSVQSLTVTYDNNSDTMNFSVEIPPGTTNLTLDTVAPSITLNSPANVSEDTDGTVNFTFTPVDNNLVNCSLLYQGGTVYRTMSATNGTINNITVTGITSSHPLGGTPLPWQVSCVDKAGYTTTSGTYSVTTYVGQATIQGSVGGGSSGVTVNAPAPNTTVTVNVPLATTPAPTPFSVDAKSMKFIALGIFVLVLIVLAIIGLFLTK